VIFFWASLAKFKIKFDPNSVDARQVYYDQNGRVIGQLNKPVILDSANQPVGTMSSMYRESWNTWHEDEEEVEQDLIVVCSFEDSAKNPPIRMLDVMEVMWIKDVTYRINIGQISEEAWIAAERQWKWIALG
jgi:hypothetical protein